MKIERFNKINEAKYQTYHIFAHFVNGIYKGTQPDFYLFKNKNNAFIFLANVVYDIYKNYEIDLDELNECTDVVELIELYEEQINNGTIENQIIFYTPSPVFTPTKSQPGAKLDDWIQIERDTEKYNL